MKLFYTDSSPYAACVKAVINEHNCHNQVEMIMTHPFDNQPAFVEANPLAKVPCLIDQGEAILDSEVICDYLDANLSGGILFEPIYADWRLKTLYSMCSGLIDTCVGLRQEDMREQEGTRSPFWVERYQTAVGRTLLQIEAKLGLFPQHITILHITLYCALLYLDFRHPTLKWRQNHPQLNAWLDHWCSHDSLKSIVYS